RPADGDQRRLRPPGRGAGRRRQTHPGGRGDERAASRRHRGDRGSGGREKLKGLSGGVWPRARHRLLLIGTLIYLALIFGVMLWRGIEIEPQWVALALLVVAAALGRGKQFIFDFVPFLLLFFAYEVMRGFASKKGFAPHDLSGMERFLFFGNLPTLVLQHAFY